MLWKDLPDIEKIGYIEDSLRSAYADKQIIDDRIRNLNLELDSIIEKRVLASIEKIPNK